MKPLSNPKASTVVITGMGWVTPLGRDVETVWQRLLAGESGVGRIGRFDAADWPTDFAAEVDDSDEADGFHPSAARHTRFALDAARGAWAMAGFAPRVGEGFRPDPERVGLYLGCGEGPLDFDRFVATNLAAWDEEAKRVDPVAWARAADVTLDPEHELEQDPHAPLAHLAAAFDARGPVGNCLTACAASTQAIGEAMLLLREGDADVMLTGGSHSMIHPLGVTGFTRLTALSTRRDSPRTASRPFSLDRDGFVMGEGAGILVLETREHAEARGATVLAEIAGYGSTADAFRITDMPDAGEGAAAAMLAALADADLTPRDIGYVSAHGTSTRENDTTETRALHSVFHADAERGSFRGATEASGTPRIPPTSSIKSMLGHLIAAAGAVEAIACVLALRDQRLPPTTNLATPDPACDLDYVPNA